MKNAPVRRLIILMLIVVLLAAAAPMGGAASGIFVNGSTDTLPAELSACYAVGASGVTLLGTESPCVMTGSGLVTLGGGEVQPTTAPGGTGTVIDRSKYVDGSQYDNAPVSLKTVKVGLNYSSGALTQAKLLNAAGSGYDFGYYDSARAFHSVGGTDETALTMIKDTNVDVDGVGTVGCFHVKLSGSYASFDAASAAAAAYDGGFPAYYNGAYYALFGNYASMTDAQAALAASGADGSAFSASKWCVVVTKSGTRQILFEYDCGTSSSLGILPRSDGGKTLTWFKGYKYYGGFQYTRLDGGNITVVNYVGLEDYVKGVVPYEMSASWPLEALKAQALCARTYVASNVNTYAKYGFDVTNDTYSQVYRGAGGANAVSDAAVDATAGKFVRYQGKLCSTFFFSSDGGATESSGNVFSTAYPYLAGVMDPFEAAVDFKYKTWTYTFSGEELAAKLASKGRSIGPVTRVSPTYSITGNCVKISFSDAAGTVVTYSKTSVYNAIGLPGCHFTVSGDSSGYTFSGGGWGHNCGMSQWGAYSMAKVYGYDSEDIIRFYFTGAYTA
jgi:stage II sporulation protein D